MESAKQTLTKLPDGSRAIVVSILDLMESAKQT